MRVLAFIAAALLFPAIAMAAPSGVPDSGRLEFTVLREGSPIGTHRLSFREQQDGTLAVDIKTDIAVKVLFVTAYRFEHQGKELWRDGKLQAISTTTNDDGTAHRLEAVRDGDRLTGTADGKTLSLPDTLGLGSLWRPDTVSHGRLMNTLTGEPMTVTVAKTGEENLVSGPAEHYVISGDLEREVWYGEDGLLKRLAFKGSDGSAIEYRLASATR